MVQRDKRDKLAEKRRWPEQKAGQFDRKLDENSVKTNNTYDENWIKSPASDSSGTRSALAAEWHVPERLWSYCVKAMINLTD